MSKNSKLIFTAIFSLFGLLTAFIITMAFLEPDDNYEMGVDALVNNLRDDTQNYANVNRGHLENYSGKTFTLTGRAYSYDSRAGRLTFDTARIIVYADFEPSKLNNKENELLAEIKRGTTIKIRGQLEKVSNFIYIKNSNLLKLFDENNKLLISNE